MGDCIPSWITMWVTVWMNSWLDDCWVLVALIRINWIIPPHPHPHARGSQDLIHGGVILTRGYHCLPVSRFVPVSLRLLVCPLEWVVFPLFYLGSCILFVFVQFVFFLFACRYVFVYVCVYSSLCLYLYPFPFSPSVVIFIFPSFFPVFSPPHSFASSLSFSLIPLHFPLLPSFNISIPPLSSHPNSLPPFNRRSKNCIFIVVFICCLWPFCFVSYC